MKSSVSILLASVFLLVSGPADEITEEDFEFHVEFQPDRKIWPVAEMSDVILADFVSSKHDKSLDLTYGEFHFVECLKGSALAKNNEGKIQLSLGQEDSPVGPGVKELADLIEGQRYLLLLDQMGTVYWIANGRHSILPVRDGQVIWSTLTKDNARPIPTPLKTVKAEIAPIDAAEKKAHQRGATDARAELREGEVNYRVPTSIYNHKAVRVVAKFVKEKYGINTIEIAGYQDRLQQIYHQAHRSTVEAYLDEKYGYNVWQYRMMPFPLPRK